VNFISTLSSCSTTSIIDINDQRQKAGFAF
jgi:hypothetical protein